MCLSPISVNIGNIKRYYTPISAGASIVDVPCGHCESCVSAVRNDYFMRCYSEMQDCLRNGGCVPFVTMTYRDSCVPMKRVTFDMELGTYDISSVRKFGSSSSDLFCFDKSHFKRFFNSFRKFLERKGLHSGLRYFVCTEYGTDVAYTQRPHYHVLFFLSSDLRAYYTTNCKFDDARFLADVEKYWSYGICRASDKGLCIDSYSGISYVSKYLNKSLNLKSLKRFRTLYSYIERNIDSFRSNFSLDCAGNVDSIFLFFLRELGSNLFILKSKNFGISAISSIRSALASGNHNLAFELYEKGFCYIKDSRINSLPYSTYFYRKLFYDRRDDNTYYLNSLGYEYFNFCFDNKFHRFVDSIRLLDWDLLPASLSHFSSFCRDFSFDNDKLFDLFIYKSFVRGCRFPLADARFLSSDFFALLSQTGRLDFLRSLRFSSLASDVDFSDFEDYCLSNNISFNKFSDSSDFCDPYFVSEFETFIKCFTTLINQSLLSQLQTYNSLHMQSRILKQLKR